MLRKLFKVQSVQYCDGVVYEPGNIHCIQGWQYYSTRVFPPRENPEKPGLGSNAFLAKVGDNGQ